METILIDIPFGEDASILAKSDNVHSCEIINDTKLQITGEKNVYVTLHFAETQYRQYTYAVTFCHDFTTGASFQYPGEHTLEITTDPWAPPKPSRFNYVGFARDTSLLLIMAVLIIAVAEFLKQNFVFHTVSLQLGGYVVIKTLLETLDKYFPDNAADN